MFPTRLFTTASATHSRSANSASLTPCAISSNTSHRVRAAHAGVGHVASSRGQSVRHRGAIQGAEQRAALHPGATAFRVDADGAHRAEVDHQAAVRDAEAEHAVPAAANPDLEAALRP
jgi:hypothetical protein